MQIEQAGFNLSAGLFFLGVIVGGHKKSSCSFYGMVPFSPLILPKGMFLYREEDADIEIVLTFPQDMDKVYYPDEEQFSVHIDELPPAKITDVTWLPGEELAIYASATEAPTLVTLDYLLNTHNLKTLSQREYQPWSDLVCKQYP